MKDILENRRNIIAVILALVTLGVVLTFASGRFVGERVVASSDDPSKVAEIMTAEPKRIEEIIVLKGQKTALVRSPSLGTVIVKNPDSDTLIDRARAAGVPVEEVGTDKHPVVDFKLILGVAMLLGTGAVFLYITGGFEKVAAKIGNVAGVRPVSRHNYERCSFDDVAGCEEAVAKLRRVARWLKSPEWYERFGAKIPKGILAVGPPGTGKTLLARALAGEVDGNFYSVDGSSFVEMFVGVGAKRVRSLFAAAIAERKRTGRPSIIFIDEIDAIGKKRGQGSSGSDSEREQTLNQLLVCMQGFERSSGIIVMAATNMADSLDAALTRPGRFDYRVAVDLPDTAGREKIFRIHSSDMSLDPSVNLRDLAVRTPQFSGADIEQACNEAAIAAAERAELKLKDEHKDFELPDHEMVLTIEDFDVGIDYVQFGDPLLSRARTMSEQDRRNTAIHEAGHSVVQQVLQAEGADPITKVTIEPRTKSLGSVQSHPIEDRYGYSERQLLVRIMTCLGGRVAQEQLLDKKDTGASNDFEQATNIARRMVMEFGMSKLEPMNVKVDPRAGSMKVGEELQDLIDSEWRRIIAECYNRVQEIIFENRDRVTLIADTLMEEQTILGSRFRELWDETEVGVLPITAYSHESSPLQSGAETLEDDETLI